MDATEERKARFDFLDIEDTQIGLPLIVPIQRIMTGAEILRQGLRVNGSIEHPAQMRLPPQRRRTGWKTVKQNQTK
jgi:hypothetical protein